MIHGFGADHRLLLPLDAGIAATGDWRRIYLDLPGFGETPAGDVASAEDVVDAIEAEIRSRIGTGTFAVLGSSFGGMMARRVAHDFREQVLGVALIAPVIIAEHARRRVPARHVHVAAPEVVASLGASAESYLQMTVIQSRRSADTFLKYALPGIEVADEAAMARIAADYSLRVEPEVASPEPFTQPTLFLTGRHDHVVGYEDAWELMPHYPNATFITMAAAGHNMHLDQPEYVDQVISQWLLQVAAAR